MRWDVMRSRWDAAQKEVLQASSQAINVSSSGLWHSTALELCVHDLWCCIFSRTCWIGPHFTDVAGVAKVTDSDLACRVHQKVCWLQVPVDNPCLMQVGQSLAGLPRPLECLLFTGSLLASCNFKQVLSVEIEKEEKAPIGLQEVAKLHDMWSVRVELQQLHLLVHALKHLPQFQRQFVDNLESKTFSCGAVADLIYDGKRPEAQLVLELICGRQLWRQGM
mmetsp:Transcript_25705/g.59410  ORF Transcript_25705/g.59410 Transcript_25705/m.59410 type:complete len:221 (-) Transcript_25705:66-728(-)